MNLITKLEKVPINEFFKLNYQLLIFTILVIVITLIFYKLLKSYKKKLDIEDSYHKIDTFKTRNLTISISQFKDIISLLINIIIVLVLVNVGILVNNVINYHSDNGKSKVDASIVEIKDKIEIKDNKLTIKELPEGFEYVKSYLNKNEPHDFKVVKDDFYQDSEIKLIDVGNREYKLSAKEFKELQSQKK